MTASVTHKPKAGTLLTGTEYEAADSHTVSGVALDTHDHDADYDALGAASAAETAAESFATTAVSDHAAASDPHTGYRLESADHSHASTGLQGGTISHANLTNVTANQHHNQAHALNSSDHTGAFDSVPLGTVTVYTGSGDPESNQTAVAGSLYLRTSGLVYIKASGSGNTGWLELLTIG